MLWGIVVSQTERQKKEQKITMLRLSMDDKVVDLLFGSTIEYRPIATADDDGGHSQVFW